MKIALTGAHGTGKTTLSNSLQSALDQACSVEICREVPRLIIDSVGQSDFFRRGNNTILRQNIIFMYQIMEDHLRGQNVDLLISDRTIVDHLAYTLDLFPEFVDQPEFPPVRSAIERWLMTYDLVFKIPIEFPVKDDGVREADIDFQNKIDTKIDDLYREFGMSPKVISGTVDERTRAIVADIMPLLNT